MLMYPTEFIRIKNLNVLKNYLCTAESFYSNITDEESKSITLNFYKVLRDIKKKDVMILKWRRLLPPYVFLLYLYSLRILFPRDECTIV